MRASPDAVISTIVAELQTEYAGVISQQAIARCVRRSVHDLRGSISLEALPEMASRLAHVRLAAGLPPGRSRPGTRPNATAARAANRAG